MSQRGTFEIGRRVRFCISPSSTAPPRGWNTFAAWPTMEGLGVFYELEVTCRGQADPVTGYLINISVIDESVRAAAIPVIRRAFLNEPRRQPGDVLRDVLRAVDPALGGHVHSICWRLSPYHAVTMTKNQQDRVLISEQFEFAAAHRLHCPTLSTEENRRIFGKCNNEAGHGHNYRLEPLVAVPLKDPSTPPPMTLASLERIVHDHVIRRFDHRNLNEDLEEFAQVNPSVEHIARACHDLLKQPIRDGGGELVRVTVWETEKTRCTYPAEPA